MFKSSENIQKREGGPDCTVSNNKYSSVTLNELTKSQRKHTVISTFITAVNLKTDINPNGARIAKTCSDCIGLKL